MSTFLVVVQIVNKHIISNTTDSVIIKSQHGLCHYNTWYKPQRTYKVHIAKIIYLEICKGIFSTY